MKLVIAEKPSVARSYAEALGCNNKKEGYIEGNGYIVSWCLGHLLELSSPEKYDEKYAVWSMDTLPIIPEKYKYTIKQESVAQYNTLKKLFNDDRVTEVVCGTDAGREGELIFRHVYNMTKCNKPIKRLWISSMEINALRKGFEQLEDGEKYYNLYQAALLRERLDWLVGYNFSRVITLVYGGGSSFSVGRVQSPTLNMIFERDKSISDFVKEKYYVVHIKKDGLDASSEHIKDINTANGIKVDCENNDIIVSDVKKENKKVDTPKLFDLTTLQREANKLYGFTADKTLKIAQYLYENGFTTYPRTDSCYLTEDMKDAANKTFISTCEFLNISYEYCEKEKLFDNSKVSDHHAIIPTNKKPGINDLKADELTLYNLVCVRLISAFFKPYLYESTNVRIKCKENEFKASGNVPIDMGFKDVEQKFLKVKKADKEKNDISIELKPGEIIKNVDIAINEDYTKPAPHYTEGTLLADMEKAGAKEMDDEVERKGIGTSATRAEVIETLVRKKYIIRDGKKLLITDKGKYLVSVAPENIKSASFTADMENDLLKVSKGQMSYETFYDSALKYINDVISELSTKEPVKESAFNDKPIKQAVAECPLCKNSIYESDKSYYCSNKDCKVVLFKDDRYLSGMKKKVTEKLAKEFFSKGFANVKGLTSKKGTKFDAKITVSFSKETGYPSYKMEFN